MGAFEDLVLVPGPLNTTRDSYGLKNEEASRCFNCSTFRGVWELDDRNRAYAPLNGTGKGLQYWKDRIYEVDGAAVRYAALGASVPVSLTVASLFSTQDSSDTQFYTWTFRNTLWLVGNVTGEVFYMEEGKPVIPLYLDYDIGNSAVLSFERPESGEPTNYTSRDWVTGDIDSTGPVYSPAEVYTFDVNFPTTGDPYDDAVISTGKMEITFDDNGVRGYSSLDLKITFDSPIDLSNVDAVSLIVESGVMTTGLNSGLWRGSAKPFRVELHDGTHDQAVSESLTSVVNVNEADGSTLQKDRVAFSVEEGHAGSIDMTAITAVTFKVRVTSEASNNAAKLILHPLEYGGANTLAETASENIVEDERAGQIEYAYRLTDSAGNSPAASTDYYVFTVGNSDSLGRRFDGSLPYMGAWFRVSPTVENTGTYSYMHIARKGSDGNWYRIDDVSGGDLVNEASPGGGDQNYWVDKLRDHEVIAGGWTNHVNYGASLPGGNFTAAQSGTVSGVTCGTGWKTVNVLCDNQGKVYFSSALDYTVYLWDDVTIDTSSLANLASPRTVEVADASDPVVAAVGQDALYLFTGQGAWAFSGDIPSQASGPWRIDGVSGIVGARGFSPYRSGVLYAGQRGLYYLEVPPAFQGNASQVRNERITTEIDDSWQWLLGSAPGSVCMCVHGEELWVFNGSRYLHRHPDGRWSSGEWVNGGGFGFHACTASQRYGVYLQSANGSVYNLGDYPTDGGTNEEGDNGTSPTWEYDTKTFVVDAHVLSSAVIASDLSDVSVTAYTERAASESITFGSGDANKSFDRSHSPGGRWQRYRITGANAVTVQSCTISLSELSSRRSS